MGRPSRNSLRGVRGQGLRAAGRSTARSYRQIDEVARRLEAWQSVKGKGRLPRGGDEKPEGKKLLEEPAGQLEGCMRQIKSEWLRSPPGRMRRAVWLEPQGEGGRVLDGPREGTGWVQSPWMILGWRLLPLALFGEYRSPCRVGD